MRLVIAQCTVDYVGRLTAHLPSARRLLLFKADGSVSVHADDRAYKPLNWMSPPCWLTEELGGDGAGVGRREQGRRAAAHHRRGRSSTTRSHELGVDPGLVKDGVEAHLQELLAEHVELLGAGYTLVRREYMTADRARSTCCAATSRAARWRSRSSGAARSTGSSSSPAISSCSTATRVLAPVQRRFRRTADQAAGAYSGDDRGIRCVTLDYDKMRGMDNDEYRLF